MANDEKAKPKETDEQDEQDEQEEQEQQQEEKSSKTPPKTPDIVGNKNAKRIRALETKLSETEKLLQDTKIELDDLRTITKKLSEVPSSKQPSKSLLTEIEEMIWPPTK